MYGIEIWGLNGAWKEVDKVHSRFCKKIIDKRNCSKRIYRYGTQQGEWERQVLGQILKYWYIVMCLETEEPIKQCSEQQKCNMGVKSWTIELKEELHIIRLAFVWRKQQECNLREMLRLKEREI